MVKRRSRIKNSAQDGFTLVETLAGLAVLAVLLAILVIFSGPLFGNLPRFGNEVRTMAQIGELQSLALRIAPDLKVPWWWPSDAIEVGPDSVRVKDLGGLNTGKNEERPDLLTMTWTDGVLKIDHGEFHYEFFIEGTVGFQMVQDGGGRTRAVDIVVGDGDRAYTVVLPLVAAPFGGSDELEVP